MPAKIAATAWPPTLAAQTPSEEATFAPKLNFFIVSTFFA
jgi:hypothetical protein